MSPERPHEKPDLLSMIRVNVKETATGIDEQFLARVLLMLAKARGNPDLTYEELHATPPFSNRCVLVVSRCRGLPTTSYMNGVRATAANSAALRTDGWAAISEGFEANDVAAAVILVSNRRKAVFAASDLLATIVARPLNDADTEWCSRLHREVTEAPPSAQVASWYLTCPVRDPRYATGPMLVTTTPFHRILNCKSLGFSRVEEPIDGDE